MQHTRKLLCIAYNKNNTVFIYLFLWKPFNAFACLASVQLSLNIYLAINALTTSRLYLLYHHLVKEHASQLNIIP
jgi:hypothetical protein